MAKISGFEKFILGIGIIVFFGGFFLINEAFKNNGGLTYQLITVSFLWFILLFMILFTSSNHSFNSELKELLQLQITENRVMQQMSKEESAHLRGKK